MGRFQTLSAEELGWLTRDPPRNELGQCIPWSLADRVISEVRWPDPVEHLDLTVERVAFSATEWHGVTFRRCVLREVQFTRTTLATATFEDVVFEHCRFEKSTLRDCRFLRCRFVACEFEFLTMLRSNLWQCVLDHLAVTVLDLRECELSGTLFAESSLLGVRGSRLQANALEFRGGQMTGADLTACLVRDMRLVGVAVAGLRIIDSQFERLALSGAGVRDLSLAGTEVRSLEIFDCEELLGGRVLESTVGEIRLESCRKVAGLLIADSRFASINVRNSALYDTSFERVVTSATSSVCGGSMEGAMFSGGRWSALQFDGTRLDGYLTVRGARFERLHFAAPQSGAALDLRLDGDQYGAGSMTWSDARGA